MQIQTLMYEYILIILKCQHIVLNYKKKKTS